MPEPTPENLWVLSLPAVRWSIETLGKQKIHSSFMMYLYLRLKDREGALSEASPSSEELKAFIQMPGNPEKPYYLPMVDRGPRDRGPLPGFWRAVNISGLWSAKTLGRSSPLRWLTDGDSAYAMPSNHADLALKNLLFNERVSAAAMGAYFLRESVFVADRTPSVGDLIDTFRGRFDYPASAESDFIKLFDSSSPDPSPTLWFEAAPTEVLEQLIG